MPKPTQDAPKCENPKCNNPVKWSGVCYRTYCSQKCNRLCNRSLQRWPIVEKEDWVEPEDLLKH
jgi:endogenous inhibitor of DNA gyrase (YacG/DUF329 family)